MNRAMKKDPTLSEREWQAVSAAFDAGISKSRV